MFLAPLSQKTGLTTISQLMLAQLAEWKERHASAAKNLELDVESDHQTIDSKN